MKNRIIKTLLILFVLSILIMAFTVIIVNNNSNPFYLENNYYGTNSMIEIKEKRLNKLINNKESFAVFIYQPMCVTSSDFENILYNFLKDNKISIYKIAFSNIKDTKLGKKIKYYPSFAIYNKGKMVDFLEANKDEDIDYYTSKKGFESWFTKYVKLKNNLSNDKNTSENISDSSEKKILEDANLKNVVKEDNKVNIYFFLGKGCPHCAEEYEFFKEIKEKYGSYYNLYSFETWYNEENQKLIYTFAKAMGDEAKGVPYTIIGNKSFTGFNEEDKKDLIDAIESQYKNSYDVYFDKIKK